SETTDATGVSYRVRRYRPRVDDGQRRVERWIDATGDSHWRVTSANNTTTIFGRTAAARVADPGNQSTVFEWLAEQWIDDRGNTVEYQWLPEDTVGVDPG